MIDTTTETLLTVNEARAEFPKAPSQATIWRWLLKGARGTILESVLIGGRRFTSKEACHRFMQGSEQSRQDAQQQGAQQRMSVHNARAILDQLGV